ncbi:MAG TPA: hypothetical protein VLQ89_05525 [Candidatus Binatia bacterium]|nr:hypothetical protein [Candidatus Binatia bacterium]
MPMAGGGTVNPHVQCHPESGKRSVTALRLQLQKLAAPAEVRPAAGREFHISRSCRNLYHFNQAFFTLNGNVLLPDFVATRLFAKRLNEKRQSLNVPEKTVKPGALNAMGLIDEILHFVAGLYNEQANPQVFKKSLLVLDKNMGHAALKKVLLRFCSDFPAIPVYLEQVQAEEYLLSTSHGLGNR